MSDETAKPSDPAELLSAMLQAPQQLFAQFLPQSAAVDGEPAGGDLAHWISVAQRLQTLWFDFQAEQLASATDKMPGMFADPAAFAGTLQGWLKGFPLANPATQQRLWDDSVALWQVVLGQVVLGQYGAGDKAAGSPELPRSEERRVGKECA